jgi:hypothetical protein
MLVSHLRTTHHAYNGEHLHTDLVEYTLLKLIPAGKYPHLNPRSTSQFDEVLPACLESVSAYIANEIAAVCVAYFRRMSR